MEVKEFLLKVSQEKDVIDDLRSLLGKEAESVGLLVSQRVMNLPPQLLPPLYDALFDEVSWATEDEVRFRLYGIKVMYISIPAGNKFFYLYNICCFTFCSQQRSSAISFVLSFI